MIQHTIHRSDWKRENDACLCVVICTRILMTPEADMLVPGKWWVWFSGMFVSLRICSALCSQFDCIHDNIDSDGACSPVMCPVVSAESSKLNGRVSKRCSLLILLLIRRWNEICAPDTRLACFKSDLQRNRRLSEACQFWSRLVLSERCCVRFP